MIRKKLKFRGVFLIVIDASKMPEYPDITKSNLNLYNTIKDQSPIGNNLHNLMYDNLEKIYGDRIAITEINLTPIESNNIHTTWSLNSTTQKSLKEDFQQAWEKKGIDIKTKWDYCVFRSN
jgi:hypothetical protein